MYKKVLVLLFAGVLMGALDIAIIGPALPAIKSFFSLSDRELPWLFNIYVLMNLIGTPLMGKFSDLYGRRIIYVINLLLFALGSLLVIASHNFSLLLVGRGIQGFGAGGIFPVASAVIGDMVPKEKQGTALGWIGAVFGLAFIIGPVLGGILLPFGWRWIFIINIPFALIIIYYAWKLLPSVKKHVWHRPDWKGMILLIASLSLFAYGMNQIDTNRFWNSLLEPRIIASLIAAVLILPVFYFQQKSSVSPTFNLSLLTSKQLLITYLIAFTAGLGEISTVYLPSLAVNAFHITESNASFMLLPLVITLFIFSPVAGRLIDRTEVRIVLLAGIILLASGLFSLYFFALSKTSFYVSSSVIGAGLSFLLGAPLRYIINNETTEESRASGQSILTLFTSTGQILGAAFAGGLIYSLGGTVHSYLSVFAILGVICLPLLPVVLKLRKYKTNNVPGH
ncbi:MAG TPA: MFS transporter [Bacteroidales bacterium]|nr:MFS transporter [Bacteroidales bacterium]